MIRLFDNAFSPFARKVRLVLEHKGLAYEPIDGLLPEAREQLAAVNPRVEVPVLQDGDVTVVNSSDIVSYLDQRYPERPIYPSDIALRVRARAWERLADTTLDAILHDVSIWTWPLLERPDSAPPGLIEAAREDLETIYGDLERELPADGFLCGDPSIADLALWPHLSGVRLLGLSFEPARCPRLTAWFDRLRRLPICRGDLERTREWMARTKAEGLRIPKIVWRGDRVEWMLARGFHEWFVSEIRQGRVGWPRR